MTNEIILLAGLIFLEASGEPFRGKAMVADTVINRRNKNGKSLEAVMLAPKQFSCFNNRAKMIEFFAEAATGRHRNDQVWRDCLLIAEAACREGYEPKTCADHNYAPARMNKPPYWAVKMREVARVGGHIFLTSENEVSK